MKLQEFFNQKRLLFLVLFAVIAFVTQRINFSGLVGAENQFFTLFQFVGPVAGAFLGPVVGVIAVFLAESVDFFVVGKELTWISLFRLAPMLFATYYFASRSKKLNVWVPLAAIAMFVAHPVGREAWIFALFWTIPIIAKLLPAKYSASVPLRALGATFMAHAVGGALWVWSVPMTSGQWIGLIPVVAYERALFAIGIAGFYIGMNALLDYVLTKFNIDVPADILNINKRYTIRA